MLFRNPKEHAANPPSTWTVVKHGRKWALCLAGHPSTYFDTKKEAEAARHTGFHATLYAKETRWFAGEKVDGWKPYSSTIRERLECLRRELRAERISYEELAELQDLAPHIEAHDVELLEAAGVSEEEYLQRLEAESVRLD